MIVGRRHTTRSGKLVGEGLGEAVEVEGKAPCVVAIHGFTGTTSELRPLTDRLAKEGYAVRAPLLPGHGSRAEQLQDSTFEHWLAAMREVYAKAKADFKGNVVLCGFSLGSLIAAELAIEDSPKALVLLGNAVRLTAPVRAMLGFIDKRSWNMPDWYLLKLWSADVRDPEQRKQIVGYDRDPIRAALEVYRAGRRLEPRLSLITCPLLAIHGARDKVCPAGNLRLVADNVGTKDVETKLYANSAHLIAADADRESVASDIVRFLGQVPVDP